MASIRFCSVFVGQNLKVSFHPSESLLVNHYFYSCVIFRRCIVRRDNFSVFICTVDLVLHSICIPVRRCFYFQGSPIIAYSPANFLIGSRRRYLIIEFLITLGSVRFIFILFSFLPLSSVPSALFYARAYLYYLFLVYFYFYFYRLFFWLEYTHTYI